MLILRYYKFTAQIKKSLNVHFNILYTEYYKYSAKTNVWQLLPNPIGIHQDSKLQGTSKQLYTLLLKAREAVPPFKILKFDSSTAIIRKVSPPSLCLTIFTEIIR